MCGIAGFFSNKDLSQSQKEQVFDIMSNMFVETQSRGTDASGFSYINKYGKLTTVKGPIIAKKMVQEQKFLALKKELPISMIAHCRAMTVGSQLDNFNNHPLVASKLVSVIHNGTISNHLSLKKKHELNPKGAVDSEVIPMLITKHMFEAINNDAENINPMVFAQSINMTAKQLDGGFACAALNEKTPNNLYLFNHTNPIVLAYCKELDTIFFASTRTIIEDSIKAMGVIKKLGIFSMPKYMVDYGSLDNDTIVSIALGDNGINLNAYELTANSRVRSWNSTAGKYIENDYEIPTAPEPLKEKSAFYGSVVSYQGAKQKEDWELAREASGYAHGYLGS